MESWDGGGRFGIGSCKVAQGTEEWRSQVVYIKWRWDEAGIFTFKGMT